MNGGRPTTRSHSARFQPNPENADDPLGLFRHFGAAAAAGVISLSRSAKALRAARWLAQRTGGFPQSVSRDPKLFARSSPPLVMKKAGL